MEQRIAFGTHVRDQITGFAGVVTGFARYITGCDQYLVAVPLKEASAELKDARWFDDQRLIEDNATPPLVLRDPRPAQQQSQGGADAPAPVK